MAYNESDPFAVRSPGHIKDPTTTARFASSPGAVTSTGAITGTNPVNMLPVFDARTGTSYIAIMDTTNMDCEEDAFYHYRIEDIVEGHKPTIRKIRIRYRDIGVANVTFTLTGENANPISRLVKLGTQAAPGIIKTTYADFVLTSKAMQLSFSRKGGTGPVDIISVTLLGTEGDGDEL